MPVATVADREAQKYQNLLREHVWLNARDNASPIDLYGTPIRRPETEARPTNWSPSSGGPPRSEPPVAVKTPMPDPAPGDCVPSTKQIATKELFAGKVWSIMTRAKISALVTFVGLVAFVVHACLQGALSVGNAYRVPNLVSEAPGIADETGFHVARTIAERLENGTAALGERPLDIAANIESYSYRAGQKAALKQLGTSAANSMDELHDFDFGRAEDLGAQEMIAVLLSTAVPRDREFIQQYLASLHMGDTTQAEIAERMGISERTLRRRISQLRQRGMSPLWQELYRGSGMNLRDMLRSRGGFVDAEFLSLAA